MLKHHTSGFLQPCNKELSSFTHWKQPALVLRSSKGLGLGLLADNDLLWSRNLLERGNSREIFIDSELCSLKGQLIIWPSSIKQAWSFPAYINVAVRGWIRESLRVKKKTTPKKKNSLRFNSLTSRRKLLQPQWRRPIQQSPVLWEHSHPLAWSELI